MSPSLRRRQAPLPQSPQEPLSESEGEFVEDEEVEEDGLPEEITELAEDEDDGEEVLGSPEPSPHLPSSLPPPGYREISTLASWTVSSSKPGCSIPQLRHPSTALFWQSDGPQPHYLNIHFFKLVRIVGLRLYLDFEADESYTPTRIVLLAGSGMNDLVEWGEMKLESPRGWVWADFEDVGEGESDSDGDEEDGEGDDAMEGDENAGLGIHPALPDDASDFENAAPRTVLPGGAAADADPMHLDPVLHASPFANHTPTNAQTATPTLPRPHPRHPFATLSSNTTPNPNPNTSRSKTPKTPVLRCHLLQIKILENHQNGKDTHLRGLQVFAKDNEKERSPERTTLALGGNVRSGDAKVSRRDGEKKEIRGWAKSEWMMEPTLR